MRGFIKKLFVICTLFCILVYTAIFIGEKNIPDNITVIESEKYDSPNIFGANLYSVDLNNNVMTESLNEKSTEIKLLNIIPVKSTVITNSKRQYVILGGELFGIKLYTDGIIIVDFDVIETESGKISPGKEADLKIGDIVKYVNNVEIKSSSHFSKILQESKGAEVTIKFERNGEKLETKFKTVLETDSGKYRAGLWVRDSTAGLGTITFYNKENNTFAGLGHPIYDIDTNEIMPIKSGTMEDVELSEIYKSSFGNVGEICGIFTGKNKGTLSINDQTGIYGYTTINKTLEIPLAVKQEVKTGDAKVYCTINNSEPKYYDIEIIKIYSNSTSVNKDMIIKVTDEELLDITGGIVQGMSGSPIVQNGKLVGAVTHVFVNNPKQGYAIFAERMFNTSNKQVKKDIEQIASAS